MISIAEIGSKVFENNKKIKLFYGHSVFKHMYNALLCHKDASQLTSIDASFR